MPQAEYQASGTKVLANTALSQTGASSASLAGSVVMNRLTTNMLGLLPGTMTNAAQQALSFTNSILSALFAAQSALLVKTHPDDARFYGGLLQACLIARNL